MFKVKRWSHSNIIFESGGNLIRTNNKQTNKQAMSDTQVQEK